MLKNKHRYFSYFLLMVMVCSVFSCKEKTDDLATIYVSVRDINTSGPIVNTEVFATKTDGTYAVSIATTGTGGVEFIDLSAGTYLIETAKNFTITDEELVTIKAGEVRSVYLEVQQ